MLDIFYFVVIYFILLWQVQITVSPCNVWNPILLKLGNIFHWICYQYQRSQSMDRCYVFIFILILICLLGDKLLLYSNIDLFIKCVKLCHTSVQCIALYSIRVKFSMLRKYNCLDFYCMYMTCSLQQACFKMLSCHWVTSPMINVYVVLFV